MPGSEPGSVGHHGLIARASGATDQHLVDDVQRQLRGAADDLTARVAAEARRQARVAQSDDGDQPAGDQRRTLRALVAKHGWQLGLADVRTVIEAADVLEIGDEIRAAIAEARKPVPDDSARPWAGADVIRRQTDSLVRHVLAPFEGTSPGAQLGNLRAMIDLQRVALSELKARVADLEGRAFKVAAVVGPNDFLVVGIAGGFTLADAVALKQRLADHLGHDRVAVVSADDIQLAVQRGDQLELCPESAADQADRVPHAYLIAVDASESCAWCGQVKP